MPFIQQGASGVFQMEFTCAFSEEINRCSYCVLFCHLNGNTIYDSRRCKKKDTIFHLKIDSSRQSCSTAFIELMMQPVPTAFLLAPET